MLASDIIRRTSRTLFDTTKVRWPSAELLDYITDAERQIVLLRPDANSKNAVMALVGGTRQTIPAGGVRLLRVVRNMGAGGTTPGRAIRPISREAMDNEVPDWHLQSGAASSIDHYFHDNVDPTRFYVYPPAAGTVGQTAALQIELIYSAVPAAITTEGQTLTLSDQYLNPVYDWVLYRCYSKDASYAGNMQRAGAHLQNFANALQVTMSIEWMSSVPPQQLAQLAPTPPG